MMTRQRTGSVYHVGGASRARPEGARPPSSDVPPAARAPSIEDVVPPQTAGAGGVENMPEELLSESQQLDDEINHAGLEIELPEEDRADAEDEHSESPPI